MFIIYSFISFLCVLFSIPFASMLNGKDEIFQCKASVQDESFSSVIFFFFFCYYSSKMEKSKIGFDKSIVL